MWVLNVVYVVKLRVETSIIVSDDQLVFTPIAGQMIKSIAEVDYLVWDCTRKQSQVLGWRQILV